MATYAQIIDYAARVHGQKIHHTCWIADVKARHGLTTRVAYNRRDASTRQVPCPADKLAPIEAALRHFGMIR